MPRGDRTGPAGMGPMTGRGAGYCAGDPAPGFVTAGWGMGAGLRGGRGRRNMYYATGQPRWARYGGGMAPYGRPVPFADPGPEVEKESLARQADALQAELDFIKARLTELEDGPEAAR